MSTAVPPVSPPLSGYALRLFGVGAVVLLANFGLLVLQLVAGKLLAPFVGSSLETWTAVIAAFLSGIALGNYLGGRASERRPSVGRLAWVLLAGVVATLWVVGLPLLLSATGVHTRLGWGVRIPVLAFALCLPVATVLSLLTPLAIRFGVPDVAHTGRVAGTIFALSNLGCLLGNYLTGFVLIPELMINSIVYAVAGLLAATGLIALAVGGGTAAPPQVATAVPPVADGRTRPALPLPVGYAVVFLCSFAGMALEMAGFRIMATLVGVSLYTWTGVIGVMLAGTCLGNWVGGRIADRVHRRGSPERPQVVLASFLLAAGVLCVFALIAYTVMSAPHSHPFAEYGSIRRVLALSFVQFFLPMALLGTISPQVIRLCVHDVATAGRTAGRIYAVSTGGAIVGTLATGFLLISVVGMKGAVLLAALLPCVAVTLLVRVWKEPAMLYVSAVVGGAFLGGLVLTFRGTGGLHEDEEIHAAESNYYAVTVTIKRHRKWQPPPDDLAAAVGGMPVELTDVIGTLRLDSLDHSKVNLDDPTFFHYRHEQVQLEAVYAAAARTPAEQRLLVIGGGGYTLPRAVRTLVPTAAVDVVEIDPMVTRMAYEHLGLDPKLGIHSIHRDGRQFVAESAAPNSYDVVTLDAVNDYSVPGHLLTRECNEAVKKTLKKDGVYLVTVIDLVRDGKLWKAEFHTLKESFKHVYLTMPDSEVEATRELSAGSFRAAATRLELPVVKADEMTWQDQLAAADAERHIPTGVPLSDADFTRVIEQEDSAAAYKVAAKRLGRPVVPDGEVTVADAIRGMGRAVVVLYASDTPLDGAALNRVVRARTDTASDTFVLSAALTEELLAREKPLVLTDQFCPVDNLMAPVFRKSGR